MDVETARAPSTMAYLVILCLCTSPNRRCIDHYSANGSSAGVAGAGAGVAGVPGAGRTGFAAGVEAGLGAPAGVAGIGAGAGV